MRTTIVMGIMSGTSIDGVDYALCAISEARLQLLARWRAEFPKALKMRLHDAARGALTSWDVAQLHHDLGRFYARHARHAATRASAARPALVGVHGQTIFHNPDPRAPATLQIGEPAYLAETLRVPVIANFRAGDLAAGGQGAPLATAFHLRAFGQRGEHVCVNNLGGISNVTSMDWTRGRSPRVLAFDTGPANVLMDLAVRRWSDGKLSFDRNGRWAAHGRPNQQWIKRWLQHSFFRKPPPKSTGREMFGDMFLNKAGSQWSRMSKFEVLATLTEFTAQSIAENYRRHLRSAPTTVVLCGGGANNRTLACRIRASLREWNNSIEVVASNVLGWPVESIEPAAFAYLAWLRWSGRAGNIPATTGANRPVPCGQICG